MVKYEFDGRSLEPYPEDALRGNVQLYLASEVDARIAELLRVIRYWIPDETMIPKGHEAAWHEHMDSIRRYL